MTGTGFRRAIYGRNHAAVEVARFSPGLVVNNRNVCNDLTPSFSVPLIPVDPPFIDPHWREGLDGNIIVVLTGADVGNTFLKISGDFLYSEIVFGPSLNPFPSITGDLPPGKNISLTLGVIAMQDPFSGEIFMSPGMEVRADAFFNGKHMTATANVPEGAPGAGTGEYLINYSLGSFTT